MKRTVSIPVNLPHERFLPLMSECAEVFNAHVDWALANKTWNKNKAHKELYHLLRLQHPCVPSALVQTIDQYSASGNNELEAVRRTAAMWMNSLPDYNYSPSVANFSQKVLNFYQQLRSNSSPQR